MVASWCSELKRQHDRRDKGFHVETELHDAWHALYARLNLPCGGFQLGQAGSAVAEGSSLEALVVDRVNVPREQFWPE